MFKSILALAAAQVATAHYALQYPEWRADTLAEVEGSVLDQYAYPCANAEFGAGNVTEWPLDGGALQIELGHHWTYVFINLGLGNDTSDFNITLTPSVWNTTGDGILCVDKVPIPENSGVTEGAIGTLQVITVGSAGTSLYNCADIRFTADAKAVNAPNCTASEVDYIVVEDQSEGGGHQGSNETEAGNSTAPDQGSDAGKTNAGIVALATFGGLAALFAMI